MGSCCAKSAPVAGVELERVEREPLEGLAGGWEWHEDAQEVAAAELRLLQRVAQELAQRTRVTTCVAVQPDEGKWSCSVPAQREDAPVELAERLLASCPTGCAPVRIALQNDRLFARLG